MKTSFIAVTASILTLAPVAWADDNTQYSYGHGYGGHYVAQEAPADDSTPRHVVEDDETNLVNEDQLKAKQTAASAAAADAAVNDPTSSEYQARVDQEGKEAIANFERSSNVPSLSTPAPVLSPEQQQQMNQIVARLNQISRESKKPATSFDSGSTTESPSDADSTEADSAPTNTTDKPVANTDTDNYDVDALIKSVRNQAKGYQEYGGRCAPAVRIALQDAGIDMTGHPYSAADYADFLENEKNFRNVTDGYDISHPQRGDIAVFKAIPGHDDGHIEVSDGKHWFSDTRQREFYPHKDYKSVDDVFQIFRH